jgi:hypothetical protein
MKTLLSLVVASLMLVSSACVIVTPNAKRTPGTSNGKKKGWFKNRHNPHNPNTDNPGKGKKHFTRLYFQ